MASLISAATGNFTASGSWGLVDATLYLDSEAATVALGTGNTDSQTFAPGVITVDGVAVKLSARAASPSGTMTVTLRNSTLGADVTSVTVNVSDLPVGGNGWAFFKFGSPQLLIVATDYIIRATTSAGSQVTLYRNGTGNNMSRMLRTTTNQAPAANDQLVVCGELTGAGALTAITITMDNTATTPFGPVVSGGPPQGVVVSLGGTFTWGVAASTAYYFRWKGVLLVAGGGVMNVGTSGARIPSTSTAVLECDCATNVDTGIQVISGTFRVYGPAKTNMWTLLTADVAGGGTVLTLGSTAGWAGGDKLAIASTTRTYSECEEVTILTVDGGGQVTLTAGVANAHGGNSTTGVQAEVLNLTQAVVFRGTSTSLCGFFFASTLAVVDVNNCEFTFWGGNTTNRVGMTLNGTSTSCSFQYVSAHDSTGQSQRVWDLNAGAASSASWLTLQHCVSYNVTRNHIFANTNGIIGASATINDLVMMSNTSESIVNLKITDGCTFSSLRVIGSSNAFNNRGMLIDSAFVATFNGLVVHSCGNQGIIVEGTNQRLTITTGAIWRNNNHGLMLNGMLGVDNGGLATVAAVAVTGVAFFGNNGAGIDIENGIAFTNFITVTSCTFNGGTTLVQSWGIQRSNSGSGLTTYDAIRVYDSTFGIGTALGSGTITLGAAAYPAQALCNNCQFGAAPLASSAAYGAYVRVQHYSSTPDDHRTYWWQGIDQTDNTIYRTAAPSERMTPNSNSSTTYKLESGDKAIPVGTGQVATVTVYVRTSVSGDGAAYVGAAPRLMLRQNNAAGVTSLTVLGTLSGGSGSFASIVGVCPTALENCTLRVYVDCNGTAGWVNVDDWSVVVA